MKSWNVNGDGEERPKENLSFWFGKIAIAYRGMKDGKEAEPVTIASWDRVTAKPWDDHGITDRSFSTPPAP